MFSLFKKCLWLLVILLGGCALALRDTEGKKPTDVVSAFVDAVQKEDFALAASYWKPGDVQNIEKNWRSSFRDFCVKEFRCDRYRVVQMPKDKLNHVLFEGHRGNRVTTFNLYLEKVGGKWRLRMDPFLSETKISEARASSVAQLLPIFLWS
jgi:hypothetical protein